MSQKIIFRTDGNTKIGLGHIYRCLTLADLLKKDFECIFYVQKPDPSLKNLLDHDYRLVELPINTDFEDEARNLPLEGSETVVLDGYQFSTQYQYEIKSKGCSLVCIDDLADQHFVSDVIINHNPYLKEQNYSSELYTRSYIGIDYALIRSVFFEKSKEKPKHKFETAFVCFGGSDSKNITLTAVKACLEAGISRINVVTGSAYIHRHVLNDAYGYDPKINHVHSAEPDQLATLIQQSDLAICPSSTISYEVAAVGKTLITGYYADNQKMIEQFLIQQNCALGIGDFNKVDVETLKSSIFKVQGLGNEHVENQKRLFKPSDQNLNAIFDKISKSKRIKVRYATQHDVETYYQWATDPVVRNFAINQEPIKYENHVEWFANKLNNHNSILYVAEFEGQVFGQVRFDKNGDNWEISYLIGKDFRGQGLAEAMLSECIKKLMNHIDGQLCLEGLVLKENIGSLKVFKRLGFTAGLEVTLKNRNFIRFKKCSRNF